MKLKNIDGSFFDLDIIEYEFPDIMGNYYDSNWLEIQIDVGIHDRTWSEKRAFITTFEIESLIDWL